MTLRISTALQNFLAENGSFKQAFDGGRIELYTGSQPAGADSAASGTLIATITNNSGAWTAETAATGTITLSSGSSGSISAITVAGMNILDRTVNYNTSLSQTAADLAAALNRSSLNHDFKATAASAVVTLTCLPGRATKWNAATVSGTAATLSLTYADMSGGVAAVNGLLFDDASSGVLVKRATQTWSGAVVSSGTQTAGWFRLYGPNADDGTADGVAAKLRMDGAIATSGAELNINPTTMTNGATQTIITFSPTVPAAV